MSQTSRRYIVSPGYDWAFFLLPPLAALWLGFALSADDLSSRVFVLFGLETTLVEVGLGTVIHAHLVAVVFRSHLNRQIFALHRVRFVLVPVVLYLAILGSTWVAVTAVVVATFWDVWHSGAQTFGFARIYERNAGVPSDVGRRLDFWANQLLYAGPILAGATLMDHVDSFESFEAVESAFFTAIPAQVAGAKGILTPLVVGFGTAFLAYYVLAHVARWRAGQRSSPLKIFLVASTGVTSIWAWGFNPWGEAFFIMNLFHAVQYLALVWAMERKRIVALFRVGDHRLGPMLAAAGFLGSVGLYGFAAQVSDPGLTAVWGATIVVSLMHFWYDGFIWSVRRAQV